MTIKVALIPPLGWESYLKLSTGVQMALAVSTCMEHGNYSFEMQDRSVAGHLVILDNGAAEGNVTPHKRVVEFAKQVGAREIVLPDVIANRYETCQLVQETLHDNEPLDNCSYMAVAQGDTIMEAKRCIEFYAKLRTRSQPSAPETATIGTIGIPRHLLVRTGQLGVRLDLANWILKEYGRQFEIHLLGASDLWPDEVKYANKYAPLVRSIDTSLPFNYAIQGVDLGESVKEDRVGTRITIERVPQYLSGSLKCDNSDLVLKNVETYLSWAA